MQCSTAFIMSVYWIGRRNDQNDAKLQVFYNCIIPPIVFYTGFSVKKKLFFKNLVTIFIFGVLGCCATGVTRASSEYGHTCILGNVVQGSGPIRRCPQVHFVLKTVLQTFDRLLGARAHAARPLHA